MTDLENWGTEQLKRWGENADACNLTRMGDLLEFRRDWLGAAKLEGHPPLLVLYTKAAPAFRLCTKALQNLIGVLREYDDKMLIKWTRAGLAIDTLRRINEFADAGAIENPQAFIERVIAQGPMTADEIIGTITTSKGYKPQTFFVNRAIHHFAKRVRIPEDRRPEFAKAVMALIEQFVVK